MTAGVRADARSRLKMPHARLSRPTVVEAVFEMRFESRSPYGVLPGRLYEHLQQEFPNVVQLDAANLPLDLPMAPAIVRHRFVADEPSRMYQTGQDVVSVNHTSYTTYDDFRADTERVVSALLLLEEVLSIKRLGLRYINRAPLNRPYDEILAIRYEIPPPLAGRIAKQVAQFEFTFDEDRLRLVIADVQVDDEKLIQFDLDFMRESPFEPIAGDAVLGWLDTAHEHVYDAFTTVMTRDYLEEIS
jgi:uncharacterized protein (TIGR04255 family)